MDKQKALKQLAYQIEHCQICKKDKIGKMVLGEGNVDADIIFMGEAPGKQEAKIGRPFIGRSGQLLRQYIQKIGLKEAEVYITSPVKYLPLKGTPTLQDINHARKYILRQIAIIDPRLIVLLGSTATQAILEEKIPVLQRHGQVIKKDHRIYFLTIHPAAAIRFQKLKSIFEADFQKLKKLIQ